MSGREDTTGPLKARSALVDILKSDPKNTDALVAIIENELKDIRKGDTRSQISDAVKGAASKAKVDKRTMDDLLYWLTETSPDARQMILVQTIEHLLEDESTKESALAALERISSKENVTMVMTWVDRGILKLDQAVFVLLYPDASDALR
ncbi:hypothetical protein EU545_02725 [Candidatus Thorarchaeota archaeon]|nr:MAG: hypothetical protein EU545_02725 [Candidatus Thorarchaeota archaeon]